MSANNIEYNTYIIRLRREIEFAHLEESCRLVQGNKESIFGSSLSRQPKGTCRVDLDGSSRYRGVLLIDRTRVGVCQKEWYRGEFLRLFMHRDCCVKRHFLLQFYLKLPLRSLGKGFESEKLSKIFKTVFRPTRRNNGLDKKGVD